MAIQSKIFYHNTEKHYTKYNNEFARRAGVTCAVMLSKLAQLYEQHIDDLVSHPRYGDGWFYATIDNVEFQTGLTRKEQDTALDKLKRLGCIEVAVFDSPPKRFIRCNDDKINEFLGIKIELLNCPNGQNGKYDLKKELKNSQKETTDLSKTADRIVQNGRFGPYKNIKHKRENIRENTYAPSCDDASTPTFSSPKSPPPKEKVQTTKPHPNVEVTVDEHAKLVDKFGIELVTEGYADLSEWKESATPQQVAKHKSDYRRLRKWVIPNLIKEHADADRIKQQAIAPHRRNSKLVTQGDYDDPSNFKIKRF